MNQWTQFNSDGVPFEFFTGDATFATLNYKEGCTLVDGHYPADEFYYSEGEVKQRPEMQLTLSANQLTLGDQLTITGIPENAVVHHSNSSETVTGEYQVTPDEVGDQMIRVECWPYQEAFVEFDVVES
ncbi:hypothetical protein [Endozoicomonas ascidiicola]|uniref:hypothetical protein n=1 Tax=Endozoicomonas ascidiicola TaxID=1698521 RepID=UPI00082B6CF6|nr:hypothetical protein [Endozoicomonas ascidiicola]